MTPKLLPACLWLAFLPLAAHAQAPAQAPAVQPHIQAFPRTPDPALTRNGSVSWPTPDALQLTANPGSDNVRYAWTTAPAPGTGWDLSGKATLQAELKNTGQHPADVQLWALASSGWDAVCSAAKLQPGESQILSCNLRDTFPDGTPKLDPTRVTGFQIILVNPRKDAAVQIRNVQASGTPAKPWARPAQRLEVPPTTDGLPAPGKRVRHPGPGGLTAALYLPPDWKPGGFYPVIAEYPGNIFFVPGCYSTGLPDHCVMGYGMSEGRGAIWVALPFVEPASNRIAENGWGDPDATASFALEFLATVFKQFGGDPARTVLTGFSRGAIACGFIGLRNDRIAALWKGFHACQHYDGDGWNGALMPDALERARRFKGRAVFQTDNPAQKFQPLMEAMGVEAVWRSSGLGAHACAMFLDQRPSTLELRQWFRDLVAAP